ncbi:MAG: hypothetical protein PHI63_03810 [Patescibacteria group bacterium]|nr:hypothetical protein [Patescibacteria group bacterium]
MVTKSWRAHNTLFWVFILSLGIATFAGLVAVCTLTIGMTPWEIIVVQASTPPPTVSSSGSLAVSGIDQLCLGDADCTKISTRCDSCECGEAVNKIYAWKYQEQYRTLCTGYLGAVCRYACATPYPRCIARRCVLSDAPAPPVSQP